MKSPIKVKEVPFSWRKSLAGLLWAATIVGPVLIPEIIADLSEWEPPNKIYGYAATSAVILLKVAYDKLTHRVPKK